MYLQNPKMKRRVGTTAVQREEVIHDLTKKWYISAGNFCPFCQCKIQKASMLYPTDDLSGSYPTERGGWRLKTTTVATSFPLQKNPPCQVLAIPERIQTNATQCMTLNIAMSETNLGDFLANFRYASYIIELNEYHIRICHGGSAPCKV